MHFALEGLSRYEAIFCVKPVKSFTHPRAGLNRWLDAMVATTQRGADNAAKSQQRRQSAVMNQPERIMYIPNFQKSVCRAVAYSPAIYSGVSERPLLSICQASLGGAEMRMRFVTNLTLGIILSSPGWADTIRLHCSETMYDKNMNKPYEIPQVFILRDFSVLHWDNKNVDLSVVTNTPEAIEAAGKATAYMPLPFQIDQCVNLELANRPTARDANGTVNEYLVSDCVKGAKVSEQEVPIDVSVTISRMTGELTIQRRQDNNSQHDTLHDGSCKVFKPLF
jgi:hypothetical protein